MTRLFKRLLKPSQSRSDIHFHVDDTGRKMLCEEPRCRPPHRVTYVISPFSR